MTTTFVFLGGVSEVLGAGIKLTRFGERVELPPDLAAETKLHGGLPCIPAAAFDALGFSDDDLKRYGPTAAHGNAPEAFLAKKIKALEALHAIRERPSSGAIPAVEVSVEKLQPANWDDPTTLGISEVK
jgi:hypothetical protein